jgi:hypothetical protein
MADAFPFFSRLNGNPHMREAGNGCIVSFIGATQGTIITQPFLLLMPASLAAFRRSVDASSMDL